MHVKIQQPFLIFGNVPVTRRAGHRKGRLEIPPRGILTGPDLRQRHDAAAPRATRRMQECCAHEWVFGMTPYYAVRPFERSTVCTTSCTLPPYLPIHTYPVCSLFQVCNVWRRNAPRTMKKRMTERASGGGEISFIGAPILLLLRRPSLASSLLRSKLISPSIPVAVRQACALNST